MIDRVAIQAAITYKRDAAPLAKLNGLQRCTKGGVEYYESSEYGKFVGLYMQIRGNRAKVECSLHKLFSKWTGGTLDNSRMFTVDEARATMRGLLDRTGLSGFPVYVTYYEIGLSMQLSNEASRYIGLVSGIVSGTENMFMEDAHFREMCQKTTRKTKNVRKVYKIYDKTFEALDRCRRHVPPNILRIETAYRKQKVPVGEFLGSYMDKTAGAFFRDWGGIQFPKAVIPVGNVRTSQFQTEWAAVIMSLGEKEFLKQVEDKYVSGEITPKQRRIRREFVKSWECTKSRFKEVTVNEGIEFFKALSDMQNIVMSS
ncbi:MULTISPECIES: hypothetical protein [Bacteroidaceae]|jgi:hypothetical protein|uniref:Uncharacterized protein n=1 Tax=Bacteroides uniformis TaxID=820 RepID=A0A1Y3VAG1_BACUN|nr:hypothetical protein [Bacteroides uniformis]OUN56137.1 hypothetical protein B5G17_04195 [Bacteroides uniformis]